MDPIRTLLRLGMKLIRAITEIRKVDQETETEYSRSKKMKETRKQFLEDLHKRNEDDPSQDD